MNETQWLFELESLRLHEEERFKEIREILDALRISLVNILGLDLMPIREDDGTLRLPKQDEYLPLSLIVGRREWLTDLGEKVEEFMAQEDIKSEMESPPPGMITSLEELEEFEADVLKLQGEGDVQFPDNPEDLKKFLRWNSPQSKFAREQLVQIIEDEKIEKKPKSEDLQEADSAESEERPKENRMKIDDA